MPSISLHQTSFRQLNTHQSSEAEGAIWQLDSCSSSIFFFIIFLSFSLLSYAFPFPSYLILSLTFSPNLSLSFLLSVPSSLWLFLHHSSFIRQCQSVTKSSLRLVPPLSLSPFLSASLPLSIFSHSLSFFPSLSLPSSYLWLPLTLIHSLSLLSPTFLSILSISHLLSTCSVLLFHPRFFLPASHCLLLAFSLFLTLTDLLLLLLLPALFLSHSLSDYLSFLLSVSSSLSFFLHHSSSSTLQYPPPC